MRAFLIACLLAIGFTALIYQSLRSRMLLPDRIIDRLEFHSGPAQIRIGTIGSSPEVFAEPVDPSHSRYV